MNNFCIYCGQRLTGAARFCSQCGNPLGDEITGQAGPGIADARFFERPGIKSPAPGKAEDPQKEQTVNGVDSSLLNQMLSMSLMNAPLVSNFLLVTNKEEAWSALYPVTLLRKLEGLEINFRTIAYYLVTGSVCTALPECDRCDVTREVHKAFFPEEKVPYLELFILPSFKPQDYGEVDKEIRGQWATVARALDDGVRQFEVQMVAPLTTSGAIMKQRLRDHEVFLKWAVDNVEKQELKQYFGKIIENGRAALKVLPDGYADHILCRARMLKDDEQQSLVLVEEEEEQEPAARKAQFKMVSRPAQRGNPRLMHGRTGTHTERISMAERTMKNVVRIRRPL